MNFIKYIKRPFNYDYDLCKEPIGQSLIMLGISLIMNMIMLLICCNKIFSILAPLANLSGIFGGHESETPSLGADGYIKLILIILIVFAAFVSALAGLILLLRKNRGLQCNFIEGYSVVGSALLFPSVLLIIPIIFTIIGGSIAFQISLLSYIIIMFISSFSLLESMKAIGLGAGISIYIISGVGALYYFVNLYAPLRMVISISLKSIKSILS